MILEEAAYMSKLALESGVVRAVLAEEPCVVLAIIKKRLRCAPFREVSVPLLASPGEQLAAGLKRRAPGLSEEVIVAVL